MKNIKFKIIAFSAFVLMLIFYGFSYSLNNDDPITVKGVFTDITRPVITMKTDDGTMYQIHIGPYWYWEENKYSLSKETQAEVTGKIIDNEIYAYTVIQNSKTIKLVDENNNPLWFNSKNGKGRGDGWGPRNGKRDCTCPQNGTGQNNGTGKCWRN